MKANHLALLKKHQGFKALGEEARETLLGHATVQSYPPSTVFIREGDPADTVCLVIEGIVRAFFNSEEGKEYVPAYYHAPATVGDMEVLSNFPQLSYMASVETVEESTILKIPAHIFAASVEKSPAMALYLMKDMATQLCIASSNAKTIAFHSLRARLARMLSDFSQQDGTHTALGRRIRIPLTQNDMADALAVRRKAVSKELSRWQQQGVIRRLGNHYIVSDPQTLKQESGGQLCNHIRVGPHHG